ncbi:hypothetical protein NPX13_g9959 [Xylaria arbuscula]|uniref:chitinase n=1 Tax=Xylaria arbuscula TaxID=114810 RepID=A0A9W8N5L7_9PEZI|nr:hypothetical protein NPX13_g9959 [Xylaria arbuscula]
MDPLKIPDYNHLTWAWLGCDNLQEGAKICLSKGNPPFPSPVEGVDCGPQKPGTKKPEKSSPWDWAKLNQCPLNACCNKWGFCGITPEFCTNTTAPGGAPGTAKNGTNGCLSNCGTKVKQASSPINTPRRIGYFEAWNLVRPCANMDISKMTDGDYYTHVHWSFGNITNNWEVDVSGLQEQFDGLKKLEDIKRILSFGGWGFSTEPYTHHIFRQGIQNGNRQILATNVVDFIIKHDLDGVDFDWEYPGAQDIPGVPPDRLDSGKNYAEFLKLVRNQLPKDKSISMALPASYWYLKGFHPVTQYEDYIDYYVYMTYDLHGQWDYGNTFVNEGCPNGNCLRSHVNKTETEYTLAMITKAGIPSTKIVPGLALYGRSFKMTSPNCKEPGCTFIGEESGATKGACTETAGYLSNIEIFGLINEGNSLENYDNVTIEEYEDEGDILIYNKDQWVAWLKPESYDARKDCKGGTGDLEEPEEDWPGYELCPETVYESLDDLQSAQKAGDVPDSCVPHMTLDTIGWLMDAAYNDYEDVNNGYDEVFDYYVDYIEKVVPAVLTNAFMWNLSISEPETWPEQGYGMECKLTLFLILFYISVTLIATSMTKTTGSLAHPKSGTSTAGRWTTA